MARPMDECDFSYVGYEQLEGAFWFDKIEEVALLDPDVSSLLASEHGREDAMCSSAPSSIVDTDKRARGRRRKGRGRSHVSAEEKRRKNREIQARYREKRKNARAELESLHGEVSEHLEQSRVENELATRRNAILERLLSVRDGVMHILERQATSEAPPLLPPDEADQRISERSTTGHSPEGPYVVSEAPISLPRPVVLGIYESLSVDNGAPVESIAEAYEVTTHLHKEYGDLTQTNPSYALIAARVKAMAGEQLVEGWRTFAAALRDILDAHGRELTNGQQASLVRWDYAEPPAALRQILPLFQEQVVILSTALRHNLPAVDALFRTASSDVGPDPAGYWRRVVLEMEISPSQRNQVLTHWRAYNTRLREIRLERTRAVESLQSAAEGSAIGAIDADGPVGSLQRMLQQYLTLFDASGRFTANPDSELLALLQLMRDVGRVWTTMQKSKMVAMAYPAFPDTVQLMRAVAALGDGSEHGQPTTGPTLGAISEGGGVV